MSCTKLTNHEKNAIAVLKNIAKAWPKSLWLFSGGGTLHVMKVGKNGGKVVTNTGAFDPDYSVATINIENDGGDW